MFEIHQQLSATLQFQAHHNCPTTVTVDDKNLELFCCHSTDSTADGVHHAKTQLCVCVCPLTVNSTGQLDSAAKISILLERIKIMGTVLSGKHPVPGH